MAKVHAHKLFAPPPYADAIRRESILNNVFQDDSARVVLLQAPAGHGKSTSLQQIKTACEGRGYLTGWLTLDEADNDTRRFLIHIQALLESVRSIAGAEMPLGGDDLSDASKRRQSDWIIDRLLSLKRRVALFLDDFQVLDNDAILAFFRELIERVPQNVRIFIGSRSMPDVGISRQVVNHHAAILRSDDLRFSPTEAEQFFNSNKKIDITRDEMDSMYRRTEGWPAALRLFQLSLGNPTVRRSLGDFSASRPREIVEYLADNVLALQTPVIQDFLLKTSLLTRLTAPLCNAISGRTDSQEILISLERAGLFVRSLDSDVRWFEYHALFASFLSEQLRSRSEKTVLEVHRLAAKWHLENGDYEETVHHAIACRDYSLAASTLNVWSPQLIAGAQLISVERWCDRLPFDEIAKRPTLAIKLAWALVFLRRREKLKPLLHLLREKQPELDAHQTTDLNIVLSMAAIAADDAAASFGIVDQVSVREQEPGGVGYFELGAAANLIAYRQLALCDFEGVREYLAIARAHGQRGDATFSRGYTDGVAGVNLLVQGRLPEALECFRLGMAEQRMQVDRSYASAALASCYIWALYEANELDLAEALFGQYHGVITESALLDFLAVAFISMVRIHDARGRFSRAAAVLDEAEVLGHANEWKRFLRALSWERVRRSLTLGDMEQAEAIIKTAGLKSHRPEPQDWLLFSEDLEGEALGAIRRAIHTSDFEVAANYLEREFLRQPGRVIRQIKLHLLDAQLQQQKGSRNAARRCLRKALELAAPGGFIRCFLDEGENVLVLLREEYQDLIESEARERYSGQSRTFVEKLLQASGTDLSRAPVSLTRKTLEPLTDREKEMLAFLANGVSNQEMARRLFVSKNTVKFHLKNIYAKLAVASRVQAIAAARHLGLIR